MARHLRPDAGDLLRRAERIERALGGPEGNDRPFGWARDAVGDTADEGDDRVAAGPDGGSNPGGSTIAAVLLRGGEGAKTAVGFITRVCDLARGDVDPADGVGSGYIRLTDPLALSDAAGEDVDPEASPAATLGAVNLGVGNAACVTVCSRTRGLRLFVIDEGSAYALAIVAVAGDLAPENVFAAEVAGALNAPSVDPEAVASGDIDLDEYLEQRESDRDG